MTHQTGKILATGNKIRMSRSANYVFDDTVSISKSLFYRVIDEDQFRVLAGSNYTIQTEGYYDGNRAYWEARQSLWLLVPSDKITSAFDIGTSGDTTVRRTVYNTGFDILNNAIHAEYVLHVSRAVSIIEVSGNTLTGLNQFIRIQHYTDGKDFFYLKNLIIKNNPLIELINGTETDFTVEEDMIIENNTITNTHLSHLKVSSNVGDVNINNNLFGYNKSFPDIAPTRHDIIEPRALINLNIKGNTFDVRFMIHSMIRIIQALNVTVTDNIIYINCPESSQDYRTIVRNVSATELKLMTICNNEITFADDASNLIILASDMLTGYTGELLTISNNSGIADEDIVLFDADSGEIIFNNFRSVNNSWIVNIQYISAISQNNIFTLNPGYYRLVLIIYLSSYPVPPASGVEFILPSTFLQDGQEITFAVSELGLNGETITISGGTVVGAPNVLADYSSFTLKYRKADDTWYLVN